MITSSHHHHHHHHRHDCHHNRHHHHHHHRHDCHYKIYLLCTFILITFSEQWLIKKRERGSRWEKQSVTSCWLKSIYWCDQSIVLIGHRHCVKKIIYRSSYIYRVGQPIGHHCTVGGSYTGVLSLTGQCPVGTSVCKKIIPPSLFHYQPLWTSKRRWSSKKRENASHNFF